MLSFVLIFFGGLWSLYNDLVLVVWNWDYIELFALDNVWVYLVYAHVAFLGYVSRGVFALVIIFVRFFRLSFLASKHHLTGAETLADPSLLLGLGLGSISQLSDAPNHLTLGWGIYGFCFMSCAFLAMSRPSFVPVSRARLHVQGTPQIIVFFCLVVLYHAGLCTFLSVLP